MLNSSSLNLKKIISDCRSMPFSHQIINYQNISGYSRAGPFSRITVISRQFHVEMRIYLHECSMRLYATVCFHIGHQKNKFLLLIDHNCHQLIVINVIWIEKKKKHQQEHVLTKKNLRCISRIHATVEAIKHSIRSPLFHRNYILQNHLSNK